MILRKMIINMTLDIEHFAKTKLIYDCSQNDLEDGYTIVDEFFTKVPYVKDSLEKGKRSYKSISGDLKRKYSDNPAIWNLVEMISFGDFIKLYEMYYLKYKSKDNYSNSLWSVKCLRNAATHNNCIINTLKNPYNINISKNAKVTTYISKIKRVSKEDRKNKMKNPIIHDFVVSLYVFNMIVKSNSTKRKFVLELNETLEGRFKENKDFFSKNAIIRDNYKFIKK